MSWCVYKHTNKTNQKVYIGITRTSTDRRWRKGEGYIMQTYFYHAIKKYGWEGFEHEILFENLTEEEAKKKEIELIALYKSNYRRYKNPSYGYNATDGGEGLSGYGKQVNQYDLYGNFIQTWYSIKEASEATNLSHSSIIACCIGKTYRAGEFMWRYWEEESDCRKIETYYSLTGFIDPQEQKRENELIRDEKEELAKIIEYSLWGEEIKIWPSIHEASKGNHSLETAICAVCQGKVLSAGGSIWRYAHPSKRPLIMPKYKRILQYKNNELIGVFLSASDAGRKTGINSSHISAVCRNNGGRKQAGGCFWRIVEIEIG